MTLSRWSTILVGVVLIGIITPLTQFLTLMTMHVEVESMSPAGWAVGIVFSLALVFGVLQIFIRQRLLGTQNLVLLYAMLTLAVPLMNLGLMRPLFVKVHLAIHHYLDAGNNTYRTAYEALPEEWFPVVPTKQGLAWSKKDQALRWLEDPEDRRDRQRARNRILLALDTELDRRGRAEQGLNEVDPEPVDPETLKDDFERLGTDEIVTVLAHPGQELLEEWTWRDRLQNRYDHLSELGGRAVESLVPVLLEFDEFYLSRLTENVARMDIPTRLRLEETLEAMHEDERRALEETMEEVTVRAPQWREWVRQLGEGDFDTVREEVTQTLLERYNAMDRAEYESIRNDFVYRISLEGRKRLMRLDGREGRPNENLDAFRNHLFSGAGDQQRKERQSFAQNVRDALERLPWRIWVKPMIFWGLLFSSIFLFLMCLAEWFRRKWVDQENLAFPLVEVADNMIRHDKDLEMAEDVCRPKPRPGVFSKVFLAGCGIGFLILTIEAMGHYNLLENRYLFQFNVSEELFDTGIWRQVPRLILVVASPIVIGIVFLLSLQMSLSIWATFLAYMLLVTLLPDVQDPLFTIGAGGSHPFPMEQMLGACVCFGLFVFYKTWMTPKEQTDAFLANSSIPPFWTRAGLIGLPLVIAGLLWHYGVAHPLLLGLFMALLLAQVITQARVRAETGLPTHHVSYDFTRLPVMFGMTGMTGAKPFAMFAQIVFVPWTLLFRTLPQQLENIELARRNGMRYSVVTVAGIFALFTAVITGLVSYVILSNYMPGWLVLGIHNHTGPQHAVSVGVTGHGLHTSHFLGEVGLDQFTQFNWVRFAYIAGGFLVVAVLLFLRTKFLRFPIHPIGYLLLLLSIYYSGVDPYFRGENYSETQSRIWFSAFLAWMIKSLVMKYGGMNAYKQLKPFFIGLVVGSIFCIFAWNMLDLGISLWAQDREDTPAWMNVFLTSFPYSPLYY